MALQWDQILFIETRKIYINNANINCERERERERMYVFCVIHDMNEVFLYLTDSLNDSPAE